MKGSISFDARKNSLTKKGYPIRVVLRSNTEAKKQHPFQTGFHSQKQHWNNKKNRVKPTHPNATDINNALDIIQIRLNELVNLSLTSYYDYNKAQKHVENKNTNIFYQDALMLNEFRKEYLAPLNWFNDIYPNAPYDMITKSLVKDFIRVLSNTSVNGKKRNPNGIAGYISNLSTIWRRLEVDRSNPFTEHRLKRVKTQSKSLSDSDIYKILNGSVNKHFSSKIGGVWNYLNYWKLCFYLGGIDFVDLVNLTYSDHIIGDRIEFTRFKGNTSAIISNKIFPEAKELLDLYKGSNDLIPMTPQQLKNFNRKGLTIFTKLKEVLELDKTPYTKSARYSFINRGRNLLIDRRVMENIVGHTGNDTHSIYESQFPNQIKDKAHKRIIDLSIE